MSSAGERTPHEALLELKRRAQRHVAFVYEGAAKPCASCATQACCDDPHFVNVHVTRLEAEAIAARLAELPAETRRAVRERARAAVDAHALGDDGDSYARTFACPLFRRGVGCLVHAGGAKPLPCIHHGCYEREEDLPPTSLEARGEAEIEALNRAAFGDDWRWRPLPLWLVD